MVFNLSSAATFWLGLLLVFSVVSWKLLIKPILNQGQPIDPPENEDQEENKDSFF